MTHTAESNGIATSESVNGVRWPFILLCCSPLLIVRIWMICARPQLYDFITYWASGHLFLTRGHPYSAVAMLATERLQGWTFANPMMTFCPPWSLPFFGAMAILPFPLAHATWLLASLALNCFSAFGLWIYFGGEKRRAWIALLVVATFVPMGGAELLGQITPLMLASLAGVLLLLESRRYFASGFLLLGIGFKPHLLYLFLLTLLIWTAKTRVWTMLAGAAASFGIATAGAVLYNPNSIDYFRHSYGAAIEISCGLGGILRSIFGVQHMWLQFVPSVFGMVWLIYYWIKHRHDWNWQMRLPLLLIVSVSTSPYNWFHDFAMILPSLVFLAVRGGYRNFYTLLSYLALQIIILASFGLSEAWMSGVSILWVAFYCFAMGEFKSNCRLNHFDSGISQLSSQPGESCQ
ncbi:glycosyltransferase family 87 protein [Acidicapsa acidisoli]|uniref:glycosyltransferase family 87 protein n=1 Tax=Acidicapsa acidisoli TaxID=1615681 RepID=UPI0021DF6A1B|nr:glycosyltransferase family 87 protein [Acidicapsa acidisoli]